MYEEATLSKSERINQSKIDLKNMEKERLQHGQKRGDLSRAIKQIAHVHNLSENTVKTTYYQTVRGKVNLEGATPSKAAETENNQSLKAIENQFKIGEYIDVRVKNIVDFGVFCETLSPPNHEGLIHISEVKNQYVTDLHLYFEIGDVIKAKITRILNENKLALSTRDESITLKPSFTRSGIPGTTPSKESKEMKENEMDEPLSDKTLMSDNQESHSSSYEGEFGDIISYMNGIVGPMSPDAKKMLREMVNQYGVFKFTIGMQKAAEDFKPDLGKIFLEKVGDKVGDGL